MKYVIWGCGERGKRIAFHIGYEKILAFIDIDKKKQGGRWKHIPIISYEEYKKDNNGCVLIITTNEDEIIPILENDGIKLFFLSSECPEDFQSPNPRDYLKNYIKKLADKGDNLVICGNSLYSLIVFEWLNAEYRHIDIYLLLQGFEEGVKKLIKEEYNELAISVEDAVSMEFDIAFVTVQDEEYDYLNCKTNKNIMRLSEEIPEYRNKRIDSFRGIHNGQECFIVATGPSLTSDDLNIIHSSNYKSISMNQIFKIFPFTDWRPDYYVAQDILVTKTYPLFWKEMDNSIIFVSDANEDFNNSNYPQNVYINHMGLIWDTNREPGFSEDIAQIVYCCGTVTYSCIQIAIYLGFKTIYLLGVDFSGYKGNRQKYDHFYSEENKVSICYSKHVELAYKKAKKYADNHGVKIINATRGGNLELFERVDFDSLF